MIVRVKLTGIDHFDEISDFITSDLKVRVKEEEGMLINDDTRSGKFVLSNSKDWKEGDKPDIIQFTLRCREVFKTSFKEYSAYPFDNLTFKYKFEFSHFEIKNEDKSTKAVVRFDFYPTLVNSISWKEGVDNLPEFDMDF